MIKLSFVLLSPFSCGIQIDMRGRRQNFDNVFNERNSCIVNSYRLCISLHIKVVCGELWEGIFSNLLIIYAWIAAGLNNSKCDDQNLLLS